MKKKDSNRYLKLVEWSDEDNLYVGTCPGLFFGGVHGKSEQKVYKELCQVVDETVDEMKKDGVKLPPATAGKEYSGKIALRIDPDLHKVLSIKALTTGESVNKYIAKALKEKTDRRA